MYSRIELAKRLLYGGYSNSLKTINKIINQSIENGFYEDENVLILACKEGSDYYDIYSFDLEWKEK